MSRPNVEALAAIIGQTGLGPGHDSWARAMATALGDRGVLVPAALTDEQVNRLQDDAERGEHYSPGRIRDHLERLARGDAEA